MLVSKKKYDQLKADYDEKSNQLVELQIKYADERSNNETFAYKVARIIDACKKHDKMQMGNLKLVTLVKRLFTYEK